MFRFQERKYRDKTDEELVTLFRTDKSPTLIGLLYVRYGHLVMGACMKYLKNPEEAEDLTMQIFESLYQKLLNHEVNHFKSWLYTVTKNECFMFLRKKGRHYHTDDHTESGDLNETDYNTEIDAQLSVLEELLPTLKEDQRKCIELFYLKERSYQQISELLSMSLMQVKSAIQNGKRNLKIRMEERNEFKPETK